MLQFSIYSKCINYISVWDKEREKQADNEIDVSVRETKTERESVRTLYRQRERYRKMQREREREGKWGTEIDRYAERKKNLYSATD